MTRSPRTTQTAKRLASVSATACTSAETLQTRRGEIVTEGSITGKPNNGAGRELHNRANLGLAGRHTCHEAFTIAQVIDSQGFLSA